MFSFFILLSLLLVPFGNWSFLSLPSNFIPATPSNLIWIISVCLFTVISQRRISALHISKLFQVSALFILSHSILALVFSPFSHEEPYLFSALILYLTTIVYFCTSVSFNPIFVFFRLYFVTAAVFIGFFYLNQLLSLSGSYLLLDGVIVLKSLRNSGFFFTEPSHYCAFVTPPLAYFLSLLFERNISLDSSTRRNCVLLCLITSSSIMLSSSLNGLLYLAFVILLVLMPFILQFSSDLFIRGRISRSIFYLFVFPLILLFTVIGFAQYDSVITVKFLSIFSHDIYDSSSGISAYALNSNLQISLASFYDNLLGSGLASYPSVYAHYNLQLFHETSGIRHYGISGLNSSDGASLYIRLLSELGLFIVIIFYFLFCSLKAFLVTSFNPVNIRYFSFSSLYCVCRLRAIYAFALSLIFCYSFRAANLQSMLLSIGIVLVARLTLALNQFYSVSPENVASPKSLLKEPTIPEKMGQLPI